MTAQLRLQIEQRIKKAVKASVMLSLGMRPIYFVCSNYTVHNIIGTATTELQYDMCKRGQTQLRVGYMPRITCKTLLQKMIPRLESKQKKIHSH